MYEELLSAESVHLTLHSVKVTHGNFFIVHALIKLQLHNNLLTNIRNTMQLFSIYKYRYKLLRYRKNYFTCILHFVVLE